MACCFIKRYIARKISLCRIYDRDVWAKSLLVFILSTLHVRAANAAAAVAALAQSTTKHAPAVIPT
jgi:hypothetical protein